jgi:hypothetical protein
VTVKAYPNPSKKYQETVCVAGVDLDKSRWIRLYPIPYRDLEDKQKFSKYSIIEVKAIKARDDSRPESFKVESASIKKVGSIDTKNGWAERRKILLLLVSHSFCEILNKSKIDDVSLGMFKPRKIEFSCKKAKLKDEDARDACYAQLTLFNKAKDTVEPIPFDFRYFFYCHNEPNCPGHSLPIIDWEIGQAYRSWRWKYKDEKVLLEKIKERWLDNMCTEKYDTYFFVGNMKRFRNNFMVLGVFYPPQGTKKKDFPKCMTRL